MPYAECFATAGLITLAFDYRYFGGSGGEPRGQLFATDQIEDVRNALCAYASASAFGPYKGKLTDFIPEFDDPLTEDDKEEMAQAQRDMLSCLAQQKPK